MGDLVQLATRRKADEQERLLAAEGARMAAYTRALDALGALGDHLAATEPGAALRADLPRCIDAVRDAYMRREAGSEQ